jgi:aerobic-type carbon monoxide dehydrogenase small subunit (CoxS/CutS family)
MTSFRFDDREVPFQPGQTVAAAQINTDILSWRRTRKAARPRGLFCGIGLCFDCLVIIDGTPNQRGCLVPAQDGMSVKTQEGNGFVAPAQ